MGDDGDGLDGAAVFLDNAGGRLVDGVDVGDQVGGDSSGDDGAGDGHVGGDKYGWDDVGDGVDGDEGEERGGKNVPGHRLCPGTSRA